MADLIPVKRRSIDKNNWSMLKKDLTPGKYYWYNGNIKDPEEEVCICRIDQRVGNSVYVTWFDRLAGKDTFAASWKNKFSYVEQAWHCSEEEVVLYCLQNGIYE